MENPAQPLTVLTEPTPFFNPRGALRNLNRTLLTRSLAWGARMGRVTFSGHPAVTRSLLHGLRALRIAHNYNPNMESGIGAHCVVLSNVDALRQAIILKREGRIKRLLVGPNLFTLPTEMGGLLASTEVDLCLVPSDWVRELYQSCMPALLGRVAVWAAGVDVDQWNVLPKLVNYLHPKVLLYVKSGMSDAEVEALSYQMKCQGADVVRLVYGTYNASQFRQVLASVDLCVFISASESQGIALQEAWACDKPTWVFDPRRWMDPSGGWHRASSAPYLTPDCGHAFYDLAGLESLSNRWKNGELRYCPRAWVSRHMTDAVCAERLFRLLLD